MGSSNGEEPKQYEIAPGWFMKCTFCGVDRFWFRKAQLNTALATFFDMDWANKSANCYVCAHCGYIHWFLPK